jgi:hypothetical protein
MTLAAHRGSYVVGIRNAESPEGEQLLRETLASIEVKQ